MRQLTTNVCLTTLLYFLSVKPLLAQKSLRNPIASVDIQDFLYQIVSVVLVLAIPVVMVMLIYAGFLYVTARGNPEQLRQAYRAFIYGIIGGVVITSGYAIIEIVQNTVKQF